MSYSFNNNKQNKSFKVPAYLVNFRNTFSLHQYILKQ